MHASHFASEPYVTVAVAFDRHARPLIEFGESLARRLGKSLCLLHVVEPWATSMGARPFGTSADFLDALRVVDASVREQASIRLRECAAWVQPGVSVETHVLEGATVATLASEAAGIGSCLLIVGSSASGGIHGASTGTALLGASPVPVLVANTAQVMPDLTKPLKLLLADDLSVQSEGAVAYAAALTAGLRSAWVHHVHVNALSAENLRTALEGAAAAAHTELSARITNDVFVALSQELTSVLESRFAAARGRSASSAACKYSSEITSGGVRLELASVIEDLAPDVLVFGRHQPIHSKPFSLGRMPFRAMLAYERPVLVVPSL